VFSFCLFILCFTTIIPLILGVILSLILRETYRRNRWELESFDAIEQDRHRGNLVVQLYDPSLDEAVSEDTANEELSPERVQNEPFGVAESNISESTGVEEVVDLVAESGASAPEPDTNPNIPEFTNTEHAETPETDSTPETQLPFSGIKPKLPIGLKDMETNLSSVFDNQDVLSDTFRIDDILDEMVDGSPPIIPADLSLRIAEGDNTEDQMNQIEMEKDNEDDQLESEENEILAQTTSQPDFNSDSLSFLPEENFHTNHSDISPMAVELLGEDFNFNTFFGDKSTPQPVREESITIDESIVISERSSEIYQVDGGFINVDDQQMRNNLLSQEQEIISLYPDHWVQNSVIEPDLSETAQQFSFTEELLPMFVRKKRKDSGKGIN
jgi:hypothetical protein